MPPILALVVWLVLLVALFIFDPAKEKKTSITLWVPVVWMFIEGSRLPSQWISGQVSTAAQAYEEGNPINRAISLTLILLAAGILLARSFNWGNFLARNAALFIFLSFALISVVWSDFPFVAFKRWFRDLGPYLAILIPLTDRRPEEAVSTVLRRLSYSLVPLSILLFKYFPEIGMQYDGWTGNRMFVGPTTSKNMLGLLCLVSAVYFFWDLACRWPQRKEKRTKRILLVDVIFLVMTVWVLDLAASTTSDVCAAMGCLVVLAASSKLFKRRPNLLKGLIPVAFGVYLILNFGLGMNGSMAQAVGKDPTLTDRTKIWAFVLGMHTNPLLGTGYQSFWLGPRLEYFWNNSGLGHINEAHNGYLQVYLDLGLIGVALLIGFLIASYRSICKRWTPSSKLPILGMATWLTLLFYNMSEAAFERGLLFMMFLMAAIAVPKRVSKRIVVESSVAVETNRDQEFTDGLKHRWDGYGYSDTAP